MQIVNKQRLKVNMLIENINIDTLKILKENN